MNDAPRTLMFPEPPLGLPVPEDADSLGVFGLLHALWRGRHWLALSTGLFLSLGLWQAFWVAVPAYLATTQMALQVRDENVVDVEAVMTGVSGDESSMNTEMAIIRSRDLVGRLVEHLDLVADPEFNPYLPDPLDRVPLSERVRTLRDILRGRSTDPVPPTEADARRATISAVAAAIGTQSPRGTYVFSISATTRDPAKSALLANTLAEIYRDDQIGLKVAATDNAARWLTGRVSELQAEIEGRQTEIARRRAEGAMVSPEGVEALNVQSIDLRQQLQTARSGAERLEDRLATLDASADPAAIIDAASDPQLSVLVRAVESGNADASERYDRRLDQVRRQLQLDLAGARSDARDLERQLAELGSTFGDQAADLLALEQFERETEAIRVLYATFQNRLKEMTVQQGVHQPDSRILSDATPGRLVSPRKPLILTLSVALGLLVGSAAVLVREARQNTVRSAEDLERTTGRTALGQIPRVDLREGPETVAHLRDKPASALSEAVRHLRTSVLLSNVDRPPRIVVVTSSVPGEGKTTLAIALAHSLSGLQKSVLLIEGDIRRQTFGAWFPRPERGPGLLSVIAGDASLDAAIHRPPGLGIDVLLGERSTVNPADVFSSERFRDLLARLRTTYDSIVIDTPPVLYVPDARVIEQQADTVLYAVRWDRTTRAQIRAGLRQFAASGTGVAGVVLTQIDPDGIRRYGYGDTYGAISSQMNPYYEV